MTFEDVQLKADQEFELQKDPNGTIEYPTKVVTFNSVHHLTIHIAGNFGSDTSSVYYVGFRGEFQQAHTHGVTICTYESAPQAQDHKGELFDHTNQQVM